MKQFLLEAAFERLEELEDEIISAWFKNRGFRVTLEVAGTPSI